MADKVPITSAIRFLRANKISYTEHLYAYEDRGGTAVSARELGVDEHAVIKTLVMEDEKAKPLIILMHGDLEVSTKNLARLLGVKTIKPCSPDAANKHTGYLVGGTSPFGLKKPLPIHMEKSILELPRIYVNGGKRGFLVGMDPKDAARLLRPVFVEAAVSGRE